MRQRDSDDRGAGLVEYALVVMLIAITSLVAVSMAGSAVQETFEEAAGGFGGTDAELTPEAKWEQAQKAYDEAIAEAKATKSSAIDKAKDEYNAAKDANKSLPKAERNQANSEAKDTFNAAKTGANETYKASVQAAKDAKNAAKAEYKANK